MIRKVYSLAMRIVAMADTHLFTEDLKSIPAGDVLVHAGDLLRGGDLAELEQGIAFLKALPHRHKIFVPGNHDRCFESDVDAARALCDGISVLIDESLTIDGVHFYGSPWQPAFNDWAFNLPRGAPLSEKWARIPHAVDVLITHGPPQGILDASEMEGRHGCSDLAKAVQERPEIALHLFGHIHPAGGVLDRGTLYANVTTWECERSPTVIDLNGGSAVPVVVPPRR